MIKNTIQNTESWSDYLPRLYATTDECARNEDWSYASYYQFSQADIAGIKRACDEYFQMCRATANHIFTRGLLGEIGCPASLTEHFALSWLNRNTTACAQIKLETTPVGFKFHHCSTSTMSRLFEASIVQWHWLQDFCPQMDQFNGIWQNLVELFERLNKNWLRGRTLTFIHGEKVSERSLVEVLRDSAEEANCGTRETSLNELCWDRDKDAFFDLRGHRIEAAYKICDLSELLGSPKGAALLRSTGSACLNELWTRVFDLPGFLDIMRELFPNHPSLLSKEEVACERLLRERGTSEIHSERWSGFMSAVQTIGPAKKEFRPSTCLHCWIVDGVSSGIGVEEYVDGKHRFVPHVVF